MQISDPDTNIYTPATGKTHQQQKKKCYPLQNQLGSSTQKYLTSVAFIIAPKFNETSNLYVCDTPCQLFFWIETPEVRLAFPIASPFHSTPSWSVPDLMHWIP